MKTPADEESAEARPAGKEAPAELKTQLINDHEHQLRGNESL